MLERGAMMGDDHVGTRVWVSWYNRHGRSFKADNGVRWFRVSVRFPWLGWRQLGGLWWKVTPRRGFKVLLPQADGPSAPVVDSTPCPYDHLPHEWEETEADWLAEARPDERPGW